MKIYNFDGPGLNTETTNKDNFISIVNKIITILPQSSIIGRLFEHKEKCRIIKSNEVALYQHDVFSWEVLGNDFVYEKELTKESNVVDKKIRLVLEAMTDFEKEQFVEGIYRIVLKTNAKSLIDLSNRKKAILGAYIKTPKKERIYVRGPIMKLLKDRVVLSFIRKSFREYSKQKNRDV